MSIRVPKKSSVKLHKISMQIQMQMKMSICDAKEPIGYQGPWNRIKEEEGYFY